MTQICVNSDMTQTCVKSNLVSRYTKSDLRSRYISMKKRKPKTNLYTACAYDPVIHDLLKKMMKEHLEELCKSEYKPNPSQKNDFNNND